MTSTLVQVGSREKKRGKRIRIFRMVFKVVRGDQKIKTEKKKNWTIRFRVANPFSTICNNSQQDKQFMKPLLSSESDEKGMDFAIPSQYNIYRYGVKQQKCLSVVNN